MIFMPLALISSSVLLLQTTSIKSFKSIFVIVSLILLVYFPFYVTEFIIEKWRKEQYHSLAHKHSEIIKKSIGDTKPAFIYFVHGTHTTWDSYPTRVINQYISNDQLKELNLKLPRPIEYLFLIPKVTLSIENRELILTGQPIVDNLYTFHDVDLKNNIIVYKLRK